MLNLITRFGLAFQHCLIGRNMCFIEDAMNLNKLDCYHVIPDQFDGPPEDNALQNAKFVREFNS